MATATDSNASQQPPAADDKAPANRRKRKLWLFILLALVVLGGLGVWAWYTLYGRWNESTDDAYVNGNVVEITPLTTGTVISIGADDGDLVHEGQPLVQFDPNDSQIDLQNAQANLAKAVRQVRGLYSNVDGMKAQVAARKAEVQRAQDNYGRRKNLASDGAISQEELSHAHDDLISAQSALSNT
ncbi:MAG: HlyD family secretion protein, partial [Proteobacteria bacterium]